MAKIKEITLDHKTGGKNGKSDKKSKTESHKNGGEADVDMDSDNSDVGIGSKGAEKEEKKMTGGYVNKGTVNTIKMENKRT
jgi:hypothetical protein